MRFSIIPVLSACLVIVFSACHPKARHESEWETALRELDRTLTRDQSINEMLEKDLAELKKLCFAEPDLRVRYHFYDRIFDGYLKYDVDSALLYAHVKDRIASRAGDPELRFDASLDHTFAILDAMGVNYSLDCRGLIGLDRQLSNENQSE